MNAEELPDECPEQIVLDSIHCEQEPGHDGPHVIHGLHDGQGNPDTTWNEPVPDQLQVIERDRLARALRANFDLGHGHDRISPDEPCADCLTDADAILSALDSTTGDPE